MSLPAWTREPLVHFLFAGALIFALFSWRGEEVDPASRTISVDRSEQAQLALVFERTMGRPPTDAELDRQIDRYIRDEVLYREALRLGLDQDDGVVRRRMSQKMDLLAAARAETEQPSDEVLQDWFERHSARFADEARYTLDQAWFSTDLKAKQEMERLKQGADFAQIGEPISLPKSLKDQPRKEVLDRFGSAFVDSIDQLEPGEEWQGPIASGLGWHVVRLTEREAVSVPPFAQVRDRVENDWRTATVAERKEKAYRLLRDAYLIEITE